MSEVNPNDWVYPKQSKDKPFKPNKESAETMSWDEYKKKVLGVDHTGFHNKLSKHIGTWPTASSTFPNPPFEEIVRAIALEAADVLIKKHQDYGPDNINNAPGGATNGLLVRMHDKMERLKTLIIGKKEPKYESVEDTLIDMINYSIIGLMVQRGKWPK